MNLPSYDTWKIRYEMRPLDTAFAEIEAQRTTISGLVCLLYECAGHVEKTGERPELIARIEDALKQI